MEFTYADILVLHPSKKRVNWKLTKANLLDEIGKDSESSPKEKAISFTYHLEKLQKIVRKYGLKDTAIILDMYEKGEIGK